ncbi:MAG: acetyl-CoA carboxylase biotin carboxyl carrier protein subunit [Bradymonadaceae bacterium]
MATDVEAHITGTVWQIEVEEGDEVEEGEDLIILESMKMEMPIESPADGTVAEILVEEDDPVDEEQVVARLE